MTARISALRRAAAITAAAAVVTVTWPPQHAWADVTVSPGQATQGTSVGVTFRVVNTSRSAALTRLRVELPEATPIAEVYPYSIANWAPRMTMRAFKPTAPSDIRTTEVAKAIEWKVSPGKAPKPGETVELSLSLNPIPMAQRLVFTIEEGYSDGTVVRWGEPGTENGAASGRPGLAVAVVPHAVLTEDAGKQTESERRSDEDGPGGPLAWMAAGSVLVALLAATSIWIRRRSAPGSELPASDGTAPHVDSSESQAIPPQTH